MRVSSVAPAKINWTLEVLRRRPDGYHEIRTVFQTVGLCDRVTVSPADGLELVVSASAGQGPDSLADVPPSQNLAFRAAALLRERLGRRPPGARIELEKVIPVGSGLGGGSSDAAATLRALDRLWRLGLPPTELARMGAQLGADVPFFLLGGTALGCARGDEVTPLPDVPPRRLLLVIARSRPTGKTAAMYVGLRPEHLSGGGASERLAAAIKAGVAPGDGDICNTFEAMVTDVLPQAASAAEHCRRLGLRPHLAGSGPAQFALLTSHAEPESLRETLTAAALDVFEVTTMTAAAATALVVEP